MTNAKWERLKTYIENNHYTDIQVLKESILNQMDYMETIDDDGNPIQA